jgi:hypothetical protein
MQEKQQPSHIRLPQRSALVRVDKAGQVVEKADKRTATQDPNIDPKRKPKTSH